MMPYIKSEIRRSLDPIIRALVGAMEDDLSVGVANYVITKIMVELFAGFGMCYSDVNDAMGVFHSAANEFYRVHAAPYEDEKSAENGGVRAGVWSDR